MITLGLEIDVADVEFEQLAASGLSSISVSGAMEMGLHRH